MKLFMEAHMPGVIIEKTVESPLHPHNTRQTGSLYLPAIKSSAYFHSFWPRTTRDIRGAMVGVLVNKRNEGIRGESLFAIVDSERREDYVYINM